MTTTAEPGPPPAAPIRVCPRCGLQAQTTAARCPNCGRRYGRRHTALKVVLGVVGAVALLITGCAAIVGVSLNSTTQKGITRAQFDSVAMGTSRAAVEERFGEPARAQDFQTQIPQLQKRPARWTCIYYAERGEKVLKAHFFGFCFAGGRLTSKSAY